MPLYDPDLTLGIPGPAFPVEERRQRVFVGPSTEVAMAREASQYTPRRWRFSVRGTTQEGRYFLSLWRQSASGALPMLWTSESGEELMVWLSMETPAAVLSHGAGSFEVELEEAL